MPDMKPNVRCEVAAVDDDAAFRGFLESQSSGIRIVAAPYGEYENPVLPPESGDFAKWLRTEHPALRVDVPEAERLVLRSSDTWLPLVYLASDIALTVYLGMVSSYLYDRLRGALRGERPAVHLKAEHMDGDSGTVRRFEFDGDAEALDAAIKELNRGEFYKQDPGA